MKKLGIVLLAALLCGPAASQTVVPSGGGGAGATPGGTSGQIQTNNGSGGFGAIAVPIPAGSGGTGEAGTLTGARKANGAGADTQAACADLSNGAAGCSATLPLSSSNGGTGVAAPTAHAVIIGEGASPVGTATIGTQFKVLTDNGAGADPTFNSVRYFYQFHTLHSSSCPQATECFAGNDLTTFSSTVWLQAPVAGTFKNLTVVTPGGPGGTAQTIVFTLQQGASTPTNTAITCTQTTGANSCSDSTHTASIAAGAKWNLDVVVSATAGSVADITWSIEFDSP